MENKKTDFGLYILGGFIGALLGVIATVLLEKSSEMDDGGQESTKKKLTKLGFGTVSALWSLIEPGKSARN